MADRKISDLTALTTPASGDFLPIVDISEAAAASKNKKITYSDFLNNIPTGTITSTMILDGTILNADINASAAIVDTKLATIATGGKVSNSATTATDANTASAIVARDASGNFSAGTITAALTGAASSNVLKAGDTMTGALVVPLASAATPSLTFTGDLDSGVFSPGANQVAVATNGTGRLFVDANGNVGVGTSSISTFGGYTTLEINNGTSGAILDLSQGDVMRARFVAVTTSATIETSGSIPFLLSPGGTEKLRVTSGGLVGVGTSSPSESIHTTGKLRVGDGGNYTVAAVQLGASNANGISYPGTNILNFITNSTAALTIDASQRVGIGTTSPAQLLHVSGSGTQAIRLENTSGTGNVNLELKLTGNTFTIGHNNSSIYFLDTAGREYLWYQGANERMRIDTSGRLLVGTSTARANFVNATETTKLQIEGAVNISAVRTDDTAFPSWLILGKTRSTGNTIVQSGDIIGRVAFEGNDGSEFVDAAFISAEVDGTPGANDMPGRLVFSTTADGAPSPTERMRITNGGDFYFNCTVATKTTEGFRVENSGQPNVSRGTNGTLIQFFHAGDGSQIGSITNSGGTATAYNTSSDYRLKENVNPVSDGITRLQQLKPSRFNFISDPDTVIDGFLAHEVQAVVPECVTGEKDAVDDEGNPVYQGIDQSKLVPLLTAALQEAIGEIESLKARVVALESA
jgi:hypothetical protein